MNNLPATVQLSTLSREIGALTEQLQPAEKDSIAKYLLSMRKAGMALPVGMSPSDLEAVYGYALSEVPSHGLKRAVEKIIKGEYEIERGFIPRPPELAAMARAEARVVREDLARLREKETTIRSLEEDKRDRPNEDAKARIRSILQQFRSDNENRKAKERGFVSHEPMSEEKAAHWLKIQALPDAKEITAEQQAFRRRIEMELPPSADSKEAAE